MTAYMNQKRPDAPRTSAPRPRVRHAAFLVFLLGACALIAAGAPAFAKSGDGKFEFIVISDTHLASVPAGQGADLLHSTPQKLPCGP